MSIPMITASHSTSTNKTILDQLLYLSIHSRLQQHDPNHRLSFCQSRKARHKKAVESIVTGILSSHQNTMNNYSMDSQFMQRLNLCRLTHLVFGRYEPTRISDLSATATYNKTQDDDGHGGGVTFNELYQAQPLESHCRLHRMLNCSQCPTRSSSSLPLATPSKHEHKPYNQTATTNYQPCALIHAIPLFLKISADLLRLALDEKQQQQINNKIVLTDEKLIGGGLPQTWYDLFLDLLTQAAIEAYLCDGQVGMESIVDIFSHGYVEDEDELDSIPLNNDDDDDDDGDGDGDERDEDGDYCPDSMWTLKAADHHLLFPKTRSMFLFKSQVWKREQEFLIAGNGVNLQNHFHRLAQTYPVASFDTSMRRFIQRALDTMDLPTLEKDKTSSQSLYTGFLDHGADGSLLIPETALDNKTYDSLTPAFSKRRRSLDSTFSSSNSSPPFKKQKI